MRSLGVIIFASLMGLAIKFDNDVCTTAQKIDYIPSDRLLPDEFIPATSTPA